MSNIPKTIRGITVAVANRIGHRRRLDEPEISREPALRFPAAGFGLLNG